MTKYCKSGRVDCDNLHMYYTFEELHSVTFTYDHERNKKETYHDRHDPSEHSILVLHIVV